MERRREFRDQSPVNGKRLAEAETQPSDATQKALRQKSKVYGVYFGLKSSSSEKLLGLFTRKSVALENVGYLKKDFEEPIKWKEINSTHWESKHSFIRVDEYPLLETMDEWLEIFPPRQ